MMLHGETAMVAATKRCPSIFWFTRIIILIDCNNRKIDIIVIVVAIMSILHLLQSNLLMDENYHYFWLWQL